jgi:hypothetical protein
MMPKEPRRHASKQRWSRREEIRAAFQEMVEGGTLVPTGEMRPSPITGEPQPVYVLREFAIEMGLIRKN